MTSELYKFLKEDGPPTTVATYTRCNLTIVGELVLVQESDVYMTFSSASTRGRREYVAPTERIEIPIEVNTFTLGRGSK